MEQAAPAALAAPAVRAALLAPAAGPATLPALQQAPVLMQAHQQVVDCWKHPCECLALVVYCEALPADLDTATAQRQVSATAATDS